MKRLIVTADDFGASSFVNEAVIRAFKEGILRFASLIVDAPAAEEAAKLAKENPGLGVGLHLDLCHEFGSDSCFPRHSGESRNPDFRAELDSGLQIAGVTNRAVWANSPALWGLRYFFSPYWRKRIASEISRQLEKFLSLGINPTHADGHTNIHIHPVIFPALLRACQKYGISRIRVPAGEYDLGRRYLKKIPFLNKVEYAAFGALGPYLKKQAKKIAPQIEILPRCFGLLRSGRMREDYVLRLLENLPEGDSEIYFHPSLDPKSRVFGDSPTKTHQTITEFETLTSPRILEALGRLDIALFSPGGLDKSKSQTKTTKSPEYGG